jgi:hypothetical protein
MRLGASALRVDQGRGVWGPTGLPELLIDQLARLGLVEMERRSRGVRRGDERGHGISGLQRGLGLLGDEPLLQCRLCCLGFAGHLFPEGLLILGLTEHGFGGVQTLGSFPMGGEALFERLAEAGELATQLGAFVRWGLRGNEGARREQGVTEGAVEPEPKLLGDLECGQGGEMVARHGVARGVAGALHFTEELGDLARQNAVILQAA